MISYALWTNCWIVKKQHIHKISVAEMRMLRWINRNTQNNRIHNEEILLKIGGPYW